MRVLTRPKTKAGVRNMIVLANDVLDSYTWVNDIEAWTVAVIQGLPIEDVIRIYGGDPNAPVGEYVFTEADNLRGDDPDHLAFHLQAFTHDGYVIAVEPDGYTGSIPEIARRCSTAGGQFFSVYWNVNAVGMLTQALDGTITAYFESLYPLAPAEPVQPAEIRPLWAIGHEIEPGLSWQACLAHLQQQTGLAFDRAWLDAKRPTYRIPDPDVMLRDVPNARQP